jgi:phosphopantetheinyl transferase
LHLARSAYGKPFVQQPPQAEQTVAFNVSHHGQYVVLAAEAHVNAADGGADGTSTASALPPLLGCDVTTCDRPPNCASISEYLNDMQSCFTANEWELIHADGSHDGPLPIDLSDALESGKVTENEARALVRFAWMWSLKESLIKAIGMGLSFELQVRHTKTTAAVRVPKNTHKSLTDSARLPFMFLLSAWFSTSNFSFPMPNVALCSVLSACASLARRPSNPLPMLPSKQLPLLRRLLPLRRFVHQSWPTGWTWRATCVGHFLPRCSWMKNTSSPCAKACASKEPTANAMMR